MTAAAIFLASFVVVFALGVQQLNVTASRYRAAFITSLVIGTATLVQLKQLPGPTTWLDIAGYLVGSALGIVASMWAYPRLFKRRLAAATTGLPPPDENAVKLGERLRLATVIADYSARSDIESFCCTRLTETGTWWDTSTLVADDEHERQFVANAVAYLHLCERLVPNPSNPRLVRFKS